MDLRFVALPLALLVGGVAGHGSMMKPIPRNGLDHLPRMDLSQSGCTMPHDRSHSVPEHQNSPCYDHMTWFCASDGTGGPWGPCNKPPEAPSTQFPEWMYSSPPKWKPESDDVANRRPWRAPGTTVPASPCGRKQSNGVDGLSLPRTPLTEDSRWHTGTIVSVAHSIGANHGGGYSWRLCFDDGNLTSSTPPDVAEQCFQQHPLRFADDVHVVQWRNGTEVTIKATQTDIGTVPAGSQWRRNPIPSTEFCAEWGPCGDCAWIKGWDAAAHPDCPAFQPPCEGCWGGVVDATGGKSNSGDEGFSVLDKVIVPELPAGNYTLQWRWDTESLPHQQVWTNCADIMVVNKAMMLV